MSMTARHAAVGPRMALYRAVESRPAMAAAMMTRECVGRKIIRAGAAAAVRDAATGRRTRSLQRGPVGRQPGSRSWRPSIQNVQIGIIERERARLLDGGPYGPVRIEVVLRIIPGIVQIFDIQGARTYRSLRECRRRCGRGQQ